MNGKYIASAWYLDCILLLLFSKTRPESQLDEDLANEIISLVIKRLPTENRPSKGTVQRERLHVLADI
jgi:hypothetical protein